MTPSSSQVQKQIRSQVDEVDPAEVRRQIGNGAVLIDVRENEEFAAGHIPGATNIDWNSPEFERRVSELDKSKTYLVHCAAGGRSAKASDRLTKLNFSSVYNLEGGMKAWAAQGLPVVRDDGTPGEVI